MVSEGAEGFPQSRPVSLGRRKESQVPRDKKISKVELLVVGFPMLVSPNTLVFSESLEKQL